MPGVWQPTTGAMLGTATGAIRIDTSDVERAGTVTKASVKQITDAFEKIGAGANKTKSPLMGLVNDIDKVKGELIGLSAAAGGLTAIGLTTAGNLQVARVQLSGLLGGLQQSTAYTEALRKKAAAAGMPFNEMLKIATTLLPALKGNTDELDRYANIADRLAVLKPEMGAAGAAEALRLAVGSGGEELGRLGRTFGIASNELQDALKQTGGDLAAALDLVLNKMGATNAAAEEMDRTWPETLARTKDAAGQLLATGFTPLLNTLTPMIEQATQFAMQLQQTNPEMLSMAAGALAITAAGGPLLLMFSQVIQSLQTIKTLGIAGTLGKAAGVGLAAAAGVGLGIEASKGIGRATGNEQLANAGLEDVFNILKQTVLVLSEVLKDLWGIMQYAGLQIKNAFWQLIETLGNAALSIAQMLKLVMPDKAAQYQKGAQEIIDFAKTMQVGSEELKKWSDDFTKWREESKTALAKSLFPDIFPSGGGGAPGETTGGAPTTADEFTAEQIDAFAQFQQDMKDLEAQGAEQRLRINEQYQEAVAAVEERLADLRKSIAKAEQDAAESEAKKEQDYQLRREQVIEDAQEESVRAAEAFNRQKERDERDHRNNLLDAGSRFDALGIIREMRSYNEKRTQANEDFAASQSQRAEELDQRLVQEAEAHEREMDELRTNNRQRLEELRQQYREEYQAAQDKLIKLRDAHIRELSDLDQKLARERDARQRAYIEQFNSLAGSLNNQIQIARQGQAQMQADLRNWWTNIRNEMNAILGQATAAIPNPSPKTGDTKGGVPVPMALGGEVSAGFYQLHDQEEVLRPDVARQIRAAMGGSINQTALAMAFSGGGTGGGISISAPISIQGAPGQPVEDIGRAVRDVLIDILDKYNKSKR
jgi:hypothetical protein